MQKKFRKACFPCLDADHLGHLGGHVEEEAPQTWQAKTYCEGLLGMSGGVPSQNEFQLTYSRTLAMCSESMGCRTLE